MRFITIYDTNETGIQNIPIKNEIKYLGIKNKNIKSKYDHIIKSIIEKNKKILNSWLQINIWMFGRILLTEMESISRWIYPSYAVAISDTKIKRIHQKQYYFI